MLGALTYSYFKDYVFFNMDGSIITVMSRYPCVMGSDNLIMEVCLFIVLFLYV